MAQRLEPPKNGGVSLFDNSFAEILVEQVGILGTNVVMLESHDLYKKFNHIEHRKQKANVYLVK